MITLQFQMLAKTAPKMRLYRFILISNGLDEPYGNEGDRFSSQNFVIRLCFDDLLTGCFVVLKEVSGVIANVFLWCGEPMKNHRKGSYWVV